MGELSYRQIHLDFHTSPYINDVGSDFDPVNFVATLKKAKVQSINVFAKCHHGMCYYPTRVGKVHPGLHRDLLGEMIKALHDENLKAPIYFPVGWEEDAAENANWLEVNAQGVLGGKEPFCAEVNRWRDLCLNKESYIEYVFKQVEEIISLYPIDGFWFDIISQHGCVCRDCRESMNKLGLSPKRQEDVQKHDMLVVTRFMKRLYSFVKERCPEALVFFNGDLAPDDGYDLEVGMNERAKYLTHIEIESLPSETWGYNHFPLYVNYHNRGYAEIIGMNGKFHNVWGDFGSLRNIEALEYECFRMIMNGSKICIGDQMHPRGELDQDVYERIGKVYEQIAAREPWCVGSAKKAEIGIMMVNGPTQKDFSANEGALRMMLELHQPFDFIDCTDDLNKYRLIILPDYAKVDKKMEEKLSAYLRNGGKLIASYMSGFDANANDFCLKELGVEYIGVSPYKPSYIVLENEFRGELPSLEYAMYQDSVSVKARPGCQSLAKEGRPYFNRTYDRFCSHRHFPFECLTGNDSIVRNGNVIYLANQVFSEYIELGVRLNRDIVEKCINFLLEDRLLYTNLPASAEVTLRTQGEKTIIHILHYIAEKKSRRMTVVDTKLPLIDVEVKVYHEKMPQRVYLAPSREPLQFTYEDQYVYVEIPKLEGHGMVVIE